MLSAAANHGEAGAAILVALGAVPGAWLRFRMVNHLQPMLPQRHWGTVAVNLLACFVLGLLVSLEASCGEGSRRLMLLIATGFLGSFSTYSTFIAEIHSLLRQRNRAEALVLVVSSVAGGLLTLTIGLSLGATR
ncbi:MAG: CrcB family protein [Cyanobacteria bacterium]|nr:CrcB family protein [Cyanobacteriota bacterium]